MRNSKFLKEFEQFLKDTAHPGSILTTKIIKQWIRSLDASHPLIQSYTDYLRSNKQQVPSEWTFKHLDKIVQYMKFLPGYYQTNKYQRRVGVGTEAKIINVKTHKVKI